jgi:hypothetical protein
LIARSRVIKLLGGIADAFQFRAIARRRIIHFDVTRNPTQIWLARQITEALPWDTAPRYLLRDRETSYGFGFRDRVRAMALKKSLPPG